MELWMIAGILFVIASALFVYSLIKKEEKEVAYKELEEFSLRVTKTVYDLNARIESLEKELQLSIEETEFPSQVTRLSKDNAITLFTRGFSTEVISRQLSLSADAVQEIIDTYISEGIRS